MRKCLLKGISLALALVLVLTVLPAVAPKAEAAGEQSVVVFEDDLSRYENVAAVKDNYAITTFNASYNVSDKGLVFTLDSDKSSGHQVFTIKNLNIPATDGVNTALKFEVTASFSNSGSTITFYYAHTSNRAYVNGDNSKCLTSADGSNTFNIKSTATTNSGLSYINETVTSFTNRTSLLSGAGGDKYTIESIKISVVSLGDNDANLLGSLAMESGYAKLESDLTLNSSMNMGANAVLDLNGHTLTLADGVKLATVAGSKIIDSSEGKPGKIICDQNDIDFKMNTSHATLPLYNVDGYIFTSPKLGAEQFLMSKESADGFTLQFRPGFGKYIENNEEKTIRETYLKNGNSGITMTVVLSWIDAFGASDNTEDLDATTAFNLMYADANSCGQLILSGAQEFKEISITVTLTSCDVVKTFDRITFVNDDVTVHYSTDIWTTDGNTEIAAYTGGAIPTGDDANNKVLVIDTIYTYTPTADKPNESMALCFNGSDSKYHPIISLRGAQSGGVYDLCGYRTSSVAESISNGEPVHIRYVVDLDTGAYRMKVGEEYEDGTFKPANKDGTFKTDLLPHMGASSNFYFKSNTADTDVTGYQFDNLLIYTMNKPEV